MPVKNLHTQNWAVSDFRSLDQSTRTSEYKG